MYSPLENAMMQRQPQQPVGATGNQAAPPHPGQHPQQQPIDWMQRQYKPAIGPGIPAPPSAPMGGAPVPPKPPMTGMPAPSMPPATGTPSVSTAPNMAQQAPVGGVGGMLQGLMGPKPPMQYGQPPKPYGQQ